jgi:ABC-2 type transport system ATP-binding protein
MSIIQIENLKKAYDTNYVLKGINLDIEAGQIVGYIGPNGAGKSTTIKILCGITSDFEGTVSVMD